MKSPTALFHIPAIKSLFAVACAATFAVTGQAAESTAQTSGLWSDTSTWAPTVIPAVSGTVHIGGGFSVDYNAGASPNMNRIFVGDNTGVASGNGTLVVSGGTLSSNSNGAGVFTVGLTTSSTGTLNITGGTLRGVGSGAGTGLQVGAGANSTGTVNVSAGALTLTAGAQLGIGAGATGHMVVSGGTVTTSTSGSTGIFYVGGRVTGATTTGTFEQSGGSVSIAADDFMGIGFSSNSTQNTLGTALITGGSFTGNVRVGRVSGSGGAGSGKLTIGAAADVNGLAQAWDISGTGEIVFELGTTDVFNAVDLTAASSTALVFSEVGAKLTIDGTNLVFSESYSPITLITFDSGSGPTALSLSNVDIDFIGFDPDFAPELVWTDTTLQLNLDVIPEPSTAVMIAVGALGATMLRRRRGSGASGSSF